MTPKAIEALSITVTSNAILLRSICEMLTNEVRFLLREHDEIERAADLLHRVQEQFESEARRLRAANARLFGDDLQ